MAIAKYIQKRAVLVFIYFFLTLNVLSQNSSSLDLKEASYNSSYKSKHVEVLNSKMHYLEMGAGDPVLFVHGNPTSSYLWRNVLPYLQEQGRLIAIDLIGFGKSDKPEIDYTYKDQIKYLEGFIKKLKLKNITLILHDWGSVLGLDYAKRNESNVKGVVLMEALIPPFVPIENYEALGPMGDTFKMWRETEAGKQMIIDQNIFIENLLPRSIIRKLTDEETETYRQPFKEKRSRKVILELVKEFPIGGEPEYTKNLIEQTGMWLEKTNTPKLHIYASPGGTNSPEFVKALTQRFKNYETAFVGSGRHFIQEDQPEAIGRAISDWYRRTQNHPGI